MHNEHFTLEANRLIIFIGTGPTEHHQQANIGGQKINVLVSMQKSAWVVYKRIDNTILHLRSLEHAATTEK